jgi:hypothetical protein
METVRSMDSALQRRSKLKSSAVAASGAQLTDSEKISLQLYLDALEYKTQVSRCLLNL